MYLYRERFFAILYVKVPKRELLRDLNIASVKGEFEVLLGQLEEEVFWNIVGDEQLEGPSAIKEKLTQILNHAPTELHIFNVITHGNTGSVNGKLYFKEKTPLEFCHVYTFKGCSKNAKIKEITSYIIEING